MKCSKALYCNDNGSSRVKTCQRKSAEGELCDYETVYGPGTPCREDLLCNYSTGKCVKHVKDAGGYKLNRCYMFAPATCRYESGFYCQHLLSGHNVGYRSVCLRKKNYGEKCLSRYECQDGVCGDPGGEVRGICVRARKIGERCTESYQCDSQPHLQNKSNKPLRYLCYGERFDRSAWSAL